ncbi:hypothetical protein Acr_00g0045210 [Actinidia rufa]|uniref:Uncharacterized protein n=1 Tax=Actinidia rufa TaxID=165716 RepID=A0A7J0DJ44_9ERIC|nr:hypothetical protein Acr_00g0045210 [Actinidia rufa]
MEDEVTRLLSSPREDPSSPESKLSIALPSIEREVNIMTLEELEQPRESCSITSTIQIRLPEEGETIMSACPSEPVPNAWCSGVCTLVLWRYHKVALSLFEFRNPFGLYKNPKPDSGWLYFRVRTKKTLFGEYPSNVKGWKRKFFFILGDNWEFPKGRISLKKLGQKLEESKSRSSVAKSTPMKGVVIGEKRPKEASITSPNKKGSTTSPNKKGQTTDGSKGNKTTLPPEAKKAKPRDATSTRVTPMLKPRDGILVNPVTMLGPRASILGSPYMAKKILFREVPSADKERKREVKDEVTLQQGHVTSLEGKMSRAQRLAKSEILVAELRQNVGHSKQLSVEQFKSSDEFQDAIEASSFKYFSEGFDFYKWQLRCHNSNLAIDLEGMGPDHNLLDEEDEELEEKQKKKKEEQKGEKEKKEGEDTSPFSP